MCLMRHRPASSCPRRKKKAAGGESQNSGCFSMSVLNPMTHFPHTFIQWRKNTMSGRDGEVRTGQFPVPSWCPQPGTHGLFLPVTKISSKNLYVCNLTLWPQNKNSEISLGLRFLHLLVLRELWGNITARGSRILQAQDNNLAQESQVLHGASGSTQWLGGSCSAHTDLHIQPH